MKRFIAKLRSSLCTTPVIAVLVAAVFVAGLFAVEHWDMLPMKGQATPMYGEMHNAASTSSVKKKSAKKKAVRAAARKRKASASSASAAAAASVN